MFVSSSFRFVSSLLSVMVFSLVVSCSASNQSSCEMKDATSDGVSQLQTAKGHQGGDCAFEWSHNNHGKNIDSHNNGAYEQSPIACCDRCKGVSACIGYTYVYKSHACWLKEAVGPSVEDKESVSGWLGDLPTKKAAGFCGTSSCVKSSHEWCSASQSNCKTCVGSWCSAVSSSQTETCLTEGQECAHPHKIIHKTCCAGTCRHSKSLGGTCQRLAAEGDCCNARGCSRCADGLECKPFPGQWSGQPNNCQAATAAKPTCAQAGQDVYDDYTFASIPVTCCDHQAAQNSDGKMLCPGKEATTMQEASDKMLWCKGGQSPRRFHMTKYCSRYTCDEQHYISCCRHEKAKQKQDQCWGHGCRYHCA